MREQHAWSQRRRRPRHQPRDTLFFFNDTATTEIYTLSLHDALPISAWAALESMAARLATQSASGQEISALRQMFATFEGGAEQAKLDEYSEVNIEFHQTIIDRKSTRLNSSHLGISYAVFCLKKKNNT